MRSRKAMLPGLCKNSPFNKMTQEEKDAIEEAKRFNKKQKDLLTRGMRSNLRKY